MNVTDESIRLRRELTQEVAASAIESEVIMKVIPNVILRDVWAYGRANDLYDNADDDSDVDHGSDEEEETEAEYNRARGFKKLSRKSLISSWGREYYDSIGGLAEYFNGLKKSTSPPLSRTYVRLILFKGYVEDADAVVALVRTKSGKETLLAGIAIYGSVVHPNYFNHARGKMPSSKERLRFETARDKCEINVLLVNKSLSVAGLGTLLTKTVMSVIMNTKSRNNDGRFRYSSIYIQNADDAYSKDLRRSPRNLFRSRLGFKKDAGHAEWYRFDTKPANIAALLE